MIFDMKVITNKFKYNLLCVNWDVTIVYFRLLVANWFQVAPVGVLGLLCTWSWEGYDEAGFVPTGGGTTETLCLEVFLLVLRLHTKTLLPGSAIDTPDYQHWSQSFLQVINVVQWVKFMCNMTWKIHIFNP